MVAHFWCVVRRMSNMQQRYRVAILGSSLHIARAIAARLQSEPYTVLVFDNADELLDVAAFHHLSLVLIAVDNYSTTDNALYRTVERLRRADVEIFVITHHHSVRHTLHLLGAGVRQCMTFPIAVERLRRKIIEHLATKPIYMEPVS